MGISTWQEGAPTGSKNTGVQVWPCEMQRSVAPAARAALTAVTTSSTVLGTMIFPSSAGRTLCSTFCAARKIYVCFWVPINQFEKHGGSCPFHGATSP